VKESLPKCKKEVPSGSKTELYVLVVGFATGGRQQRQASCLFCILEEWAEQQMKKVK